MRNDKALSMKDMKFQKAVVFDRPSTILPHRPRVPSVVLWATQVRYRRSADRFVLLSRRSVWGSGRRAVGSG